MNSNAHFVLLTHITVQVLISTVLIVMFLGPFQRLIETASWGDDVAAIEQQLHNHQRFHSSIQRSVELDRARDDLVSTHYLLDAGG